MAYFAFIEIIEKIQVISLNVDNALFYFCKNPKISAIIFSPKSIILRIDDHSEYSIVWSESFQA